MKKILVLLVVSLLFLGCQKSDIQGNEDEKKEIVVSDSFVIIKTADGDVRVDVEEASSPMQKAKGLSGRPVIEKGMFFIFEAEGDYSFTTVDMEAPIDIFFIDSNEKIVHLIKDVQPGIAVIKSDVPFQFVLETKSGFADENKVEVGNDASWFLDNKKDES